MQTADSARPRRLMRDGQDAREVYSDERPRVYIHDSVLACESSPLVSWEQKRPELHCANISRTYGSQHQPFVLVMDHADHSR